LKNDMSVIMSDMIVKEGLGITDLVAWFKELDVRNLDADVKRWKELFSIAAINVNWIRGELGLDKVDHGEQYYVASNFLPVGAETVDMERRAIDAELAELHRKVDEVLDEYRSKKG